MDEGAWTPVKNALQSGDYVLIQFGHNDEKNEEPTLFTDPQTTYKQFLTTYVTDTRAKMATPILLTSPTAWLGSSAMRQRPTTASIARMVDLAPVRGRELRICLTAS
jgi:lysophospholipase L1-like esterase